MLYPFLLYIALCYLMRDAGLFVSSLTLARERCRERGREVGREVSRKKSGY